MLIHQPQLTPSQLEQLEAAKQRRAKIAAKAKALQPAPPPKPALKLEPAPPPTPDWASLQKKKFGEHIKIPRGAFSASMIQMICAEHFGVAVSAMSSPRRLSSFVRPRQVAMYFMKKYVTRLSLPHIGRHFGNRDHTTVLHALQRIEYLKNNEPGFAEVIEKLRVQIEEAAAVHRAEELAATRANQPLERELLDALLKRPATSNSDT